MEIREFIEADLPQVIECLKGVWQVGEIDSAILLDFLSNQNRLFVVEQGSKIVGCATLHIQQKLIRNGGKAAFIEEVVVRSENRGSGIGQKLIEELIKTAKAVGCYKVTLCCYPERIAFYERCGFRQENTTMRIDL